MSGVSVLITDNDCTSSEGRTSRATARRSLSGEGTRVPLMVTLLRSGPRPRTLTKRPSPWSRSTLMPGKRCTASATFSSGNCATPSACTTLLMLSEERCSLRALSIAAAWPTTSTCSVVAASAALTRSQAIARAKAVSVKLTSPVRLYMKPSPRIRWRQARGPATGRAR